MKKIPALFALLALVFTVMYCGGRKNKDQAKASEEYRFVLGTCPTYKVKISPCKIENPECTIKSDCTIHLQATAYDRQGNIRDVSLHWRFRNPDADADNKAGGGHEIMVHDDRHAVFKASGTAPDTFTVLAQDRTCNLGTDKEPQYVEGESWIKVYDDLGDKVACGRMRVTYGDKVDHLGDMIIASAKSLLVAEVSADQDLGFNYRVRFYLNEKPYPLARPLYKEAEVPLSPGMTKGYKALLPLYLTPGRYTARYELLKQGQTICGSKLISFGAR